ncbi:spartin-like [Plakobranchus ocellatus]|uniref:Spartin-like n=1 Tax=Plakobranchus ocellatus TaxID=259542 RepID=A0AAV3ZE97_9GAST|nr:spartin-like [Plakobranchus ocellatus]
MALHQEDRCPPPRPTVPPSHSQNGSSHTHSSLSLPVYIKTYEDFLKVHDAAYKLVNAGLAADERGEEDVAEVSYRDGFQLMDRCLRCDLGNGELVRVMSPRHLEQAQDMQTKLNKTRQQVIYRLRDLETRNSQLRNHGHTQAEMGELQSPHSPVGACALPSYEEALSDSASQPPAYDEDELTALGESLMLAEAGTTAPPANATELLSIPDGVQIFFISPNGLVSAPSYPAALHIVTFDREAGQEPSGHTGAPPAFLYVGEWVYPLIPGTSPSLHTSYGAYIFPDVTTGQSGSAVGLMLPEQEPGVRQQFENLINRFTVMGSEVSGHQEQPASVAVETGREGEARENEVIEEKDTASKISKGILVAADWIAWGVGKGAEKAGELMRAGSERIRRGSEPVVEHRKVDPRVQQGVQYARKATHGAVKVTGYIVNKLGEATVVLAKQIAPHVRRQGEKVVPKSLTKEDSTGKSKLDGVVKVAASGLQGFGTVFMGLEHAAKSLGKSLTQETVQVVTHKYGDEAGALTENTMYAAGNVAMAAYNVDNIGIKAVAKRTAKETGKAVLHDLHNEKQAKGGKDGQTRQPPDYGSSGDTGRKHR